MKDAERGGREVGIATKACGGGADSLASLHGAYYVVSGLWPVLHLRSLAAVSGPKPEGGLKAVGLLLTSIGVTLLTGARTRERNTTAVLGARAALALGGVSSRHAAKGRISPVYSLDSCVHLGLTSAWSAILLASLSSSRGRERLA